jgi:L,D-transpeptidase ErfK/SrfK
MWNNGISRCRRAAGPCRFARLERRRFLLPLLLLLLLAATGTAADEVHRRTGRLAVVSPPSPVIAVDLRDGDMAAFLVGRIDASSLLLRGGHPAGLQEFKVGETVKVTWRKSAEGTRILTLLAGEESAPPPPGFLPVLRSPTDVGAVIGQVRRHTVAGEDTYLDVARLYDLGFNEIMELYPADDPWLPTVGKVLEIPTRWLLPHAPFAGIVVNIPEMRLFDFRRQGGRELVRTFPIGVGDTDFPTPTGIFRIGAKSLHPTWYIPQTLRQKYGQATFPPGPDNPLGDHWIGLAGTSYGIHGTDIPWSVGRLVTRGCIRMYPEDIELFFPSVSTGAEVRLVYQPVKVAFVSGRLLIEVHHDIYARAGNLAVQGLDLIGRLGLLNLLDKMKFVQAIDRRDGMPRDITRDRDSKPETAAGNTTLPPPESSRLFSPGG